MYFGLAFFFSFIFLYIGILYFNVLVPSIGSSHEISLRSKEGIGDFKMIEELGGEEVHHHASGIEVSERELQKIK